MGTYTLDIGAVEAPDTALVGGKGAGLLRLATAGFRVPPGFIVTTTAYRDFVTATGLHQDGTGTLHDRIPAEPIPDPVAAAVSEAYRAMGEPAVAVRSSGTAEDLAGASFAGQHDTYLNVTGEQQVLDAMRDCWASLWTPRAIDYRRQYGWDDDGLAIAVVIQRMIDAEWAGVMFTADPVGGRRDRVVIEAVAGLGESLVSGEQGGYRHLVDKRTTMPLPADSPVPTATIEELGRLGLGVERAFGTEQDIEWAVSDGRCFLVQARPLTGLPSERDGDEPRAGTDRVRVRMAQNLGERMPYPPFPMDYDLFIRRAVSGLLGMLDSVGIAVSTPDEMLTGGIDEVLHITPPRIRPSARMLTRFPARLPTIVRTLRTPRQRWLRESEATIGELVRHADTDDLTALPEHELLGRVSELLDTAARAVPSRFGAALPALLLAESALGAMLRAAVGPEHAERLHDDLKAGIPSVTSHANRDIHALADTIRTDEQLAAVYREEAPSRVAERLAESRAGRALLAGIAEYLLRYRHRELAIGSVGLDSLGDSPEVVHGMLASLAAGPPRPSEADTAARPERAARELHEQWGPRAKVLAPVILRAARSARAGAGFREDSHYALYSVFPALRRLLTEFGNRLVARGALTEAQDVYYLTLDEARQGAPDRLAGLAARRKAARDAELGRYTIVSGAPPSTSGTGDVRGLPASRGVASGVVRVVRSEAELGKLKAGEVLVCPFTNPAWTPLFAVASAVVVDGGGAASHAAIVAREYGIPAVMGTGNGATVLTDGTRVTVDGTAGTVTPEESP